MSSGITCTIRLPQHLQHFFSGKVGVSLLIKQRNDFFARVIFTYLKKRPNFVLIQIQKEYCFEFELPNYSAINISSGLYYIPAESFEIIEQLLEHYFDSVFFSHLVRYDTMQDAVYKFAENYGMELTERTYQMLKKRFYRARNEDLINVKKHKKKYHNLSLNVLELSPVEIN